MNEAYSEGKRNREIGIEWMKAWYMNEKKEKQEDSVKMKEMSNEIGK